MKKAVLYIHGKGGSANEAEHYKGLFPEYDVIGFDYKSGTPWDCKPEFKSKINEIKSRLILDQVKQSKDNLDEYIKIIKKSENNEFSSTELAAGLLKMIREN